MQITHATFVGSHHFFHTIRELGSKLVLGSAHCNRLLCYNINLEFSFAGEMKLIGNGRDLLDAVIASAKAGEFTKEDADFAVEQLQRITLHFNTRRTLFHAQHEIEEVTAQVDADVSVVAPVVSDDKAEPQEEVSAIEEKDSEESLTEDGDVANIASEAKPKRGRKASK